MNLICFGLLLMVCHPIQETGAQRVTVSACPVAAPWNADYQRRLAGEVRALPPGSALEAAIAEAISLRDQARACRAAGRASKP